MRTIHLLFLVACATTSTPDDADTGDTTPVSKAVPWSAEQPALDEAIGEVDGLVPRRAVIHLHSPYSHDACDGMGWVDGEMDTACRDDLLDALCRTRFDLAYMTDHPDYGDVQAFDDLFHADGKGTWVREDGVVAYRHVCDDGHEVSIRAGFEDELMPVHLTSHIDDDGPTRHDLLNRTDATAIDAMTDAGGAVMLAHLETRAYEDLERMQDDGLTGVEAYNLHAAFGPDLRVALGFDAFGWLGDAGPFLDGEPGIEPDLYFLAVHARQEPTEARVDHLLARGPITITAGTDAHQNVLQAALADGERADSYRRMLRWFSTWLWTSPAPEGVDAREKLADEALAAGRTWIVFEALGIPEGLTFDVTAPDGTFGEGDVEVSVTCPTLWSGSPRGEDDPEILVEVLKDGEVWKTGCGTWETGPGVYRVRVDMVPHHLEPFLGETAETLIRRMPWVLTGGIRAVTSAD